MQDKIPERKSSVNLRVLIVGDASVGKTSLVSRFVENKFQPLTTATVGVDFKVTKFEIPDIVPTSPQLDKKPQANTSNSSSGSDSSRLTTLMTEMYIWDPAGSDKYRQVTQSFFTGVDAILVAFDITNQQSFAGAKEWKQDIQNFLSQHPTKKVKLILVGTKEDLSESRQIEFTTAYTFAMENKMNYFECSAASGKGVQDIFHFLAFHVLNHTDKKSKKIEKIEHLKRPVLKGQPTPNAFNQPELAGGCCTIL